MKVRVAIVEDRPLLRFSLQKDLEQEPRIEFLFAAEHGQHFLDQLDAAAGQLPEVVLMDIEMPTMNGIEAVARAKEKFPDMKFIMLTIYPDDENLIKAIQAGASGYLLKDESTERIINAITNVEEGGAQLSPVMALKAIELLKNMSDAPSPNSIKNTGNEFDLTPREFEVLKMVVDGLSYAAIGEQMFISTGTVRKHIQNIYLKMQVNSKAKAINLAVKNRWFDI